MSNTVVFTSPTLDGVMQAPGRPDKDPVLGSGRRLLESVTTTGVPVATSQSTRTNASHPHQL
jgi:hypothetical protein